VKQKRGLLQYTLQGLFSAEKCTKWKLRCEYFGALSNINTKDNPPPLQKRWRHNAFLRSPRSYLVINQTKISLKAFRI